MALICPQSPKFETKQGIKSLSVDFYKHLVQMPLPVRVGSHSIHPFSANFRGKHRAEPNPPETDGFMADIDPTFVEKVHNFAQRKWQPNVEHHRQADDLWTRFEIAKWPAFCHAGKLCGPPAHLKPFSSDSAREASRPPTRFKPVLSDKPFEIFMILSTFPARGRRSSR